MTANAQTPGRYQRPGAQPNRGKDPQMSTRKYSTRSDAKAVAAAALCGLCIPAGFLAAADTAMATDTEARVAVCHYTGNAPNPWQQINVSPAGAVDGHLGLDHQRGRDIIPPFTYKGETYSQNWNLLGKLLWVHDCVPGPHPPVVPPKVERYGCDGKLIADGAQPPTCPGETRTVTVDRPVEVVKTITVPKLVNVTKWRTRVKVRHVTRWRTRYVCRKPTPHRPKFTG